ncbi:hypothetical protein ON010_g19029 [Phytophthora cinnamomi]|nr:hypothetical protein ON010_g19029 [Phytophthora cinnamomi]
MSSSSGSSAPVSGSDAAAPREAELDVHGGRRLLEHLVKGAAGVGGERGAGGDAGRRWKTVGGVDGDDEWSKSDLPRVDVATFKTPSKRFDARSLITPVVSSCRESTRLIRSVECARHAKCVCGFVYLGGKGTFIEDK